MQIQFAHDVLAVPFHRFGTDHQGDGDLIVAGTFSEIPQDLALALCKAVQVRLLRRRVFLAEIICDQELGKGRI